MELSSVVTSGSLKKRKQTGTQGIEETEMGLMRSLEESIRRRAASYHAQQDDDALFAQLLASQLKQLPAHQKVIVKMEITSITYRSLLSSSSHEVATQKITHHNMASNHGTTGSGITNQGVLLYQGIEEGGPQYLPGYFFENR